MEWTFRCYLSDSGNCAIGGWYDSLPKKVQARLDVVLEYLEDRPIGDWTTSHFITPLSGYSGIYEIKVRVGNYLCRPLGYFGPKQGEFTFLIGAREQGDAFVPKNAPKLARLRRTIAQNNEERSHERCF